MSEETANGTEAVLEEDNFVESTLRKWGLQEYSPNFQREKIDKNIFLTLPDDAVSKLIPFMGPCYKFLTERHKLELSSSEQPTSEHTAKKFTEPGQTIRTFLRKTNKGKYLLAQKYLKDTDENVLCTLIVDHLHDKSFRISRDHFNFWAHEIVTLYPTESKDKWYQESKRGKPATGKLYNKYANLNKRIKKVVKKFEKRELNEVETRDSEESDKNLQELQCIPLDNLKKIEELWRKTFKSRDRTGDLATYFELYPQLHPPLGITLVELDYELLNISEEKLVTKWPELSEKLLRLARQNSACTRILDDSADIPADTLAFRVLPYLFRPINTKTGSMKKVWKPTYEEQANGFIAWISVITDLEEALQAQRKLMEMYKLPMQPIIIAVGALRQLEATYVVINDMKYKFESLLPAVEFCFKSFFALDIMYPASSEAVWVFIQIEIYGIKEVQKPFQSVLSMQTKLAKLAHMIESDSNDDAADNESF